MTARIKFLSFRFLFRLFDFLAEKSGGWAMFVRPKLIFGSLIVGLGFTNCDSKAPIHKPQELRKSIIKKEDVKDSISTNKSTKKKNTTKFVSSIPSCYDFEVVEKDTIKTMTIASCYETVEFKSPIDSIYVNVEQMPEFPSGQGSLDIFINKNLRWPDTEVDAQGRVICRFAVLTDGSISHIQILKGIHPTLDEEAIRVIKLMPKWIPGKQNGKAVSVWYTLPIMFALQN